MLSRKEKYVLKKIIKRSKNGNPCFDDPKELFEMVYPKITYDELGLILDSLLEKGFLYDSDYVKLLDGGRQFTIKQKAFDYSENTKKEFLKFIVCSIITPIIVSFITALLTSLVTSSGK